MCLVCRRASWETFEFSVEAWSSVLDQLGADEPSRMALFTLAQHTHSAAVEVMWKIVKKLNDGFHINSPSAFLHSNVKNAWHRIAPWDR